MAYLDPAAEPVVARARAVRLTANLRTGRAAGLDPETDTDTSSVLDHLAVAWPADEDKAWWDDLADRSAQLPRPLRRVNRRAGVGRGTSA